jgi:hypothetical protein
MLRHAAVIFTLLATPCAAQTAAPTPEPQRTREAPRTGDRFEISGDECGASRYAHLVGRDYATVYHASLVPAGANVVNRSLFKTLEYTPWRLNVVLDLYGRISAVGCF